VDFHRALTHQTLQFRCAEKSDLQRLDEASLKGKTIGAPARDYRLPVLEDNMGDVVNVRLYEHPGKSLPDMNSGQLSMRTGQTTFVHNEWLQERWLVPNFEFKGDPVFRQRQESALPCARATHCVSV